MGTEAIIVRPDAGVKTIADLKGKTLLTTANAGVNTFFPLVLKNAGLAEGDVKHHQRAGRRAGLELSAGSRRRGRHARRPRRQAGRDQGQWRRAQPVTFPYSDFGVNQVGYCIVTTTDTVKNNPDLVKRFMAATVKSYKEAEKNPDAAVAAMADIVGGTMAEDAGQGAGARGARRHARHPLLQGQQRQEARPQRARPTGTTCWR